MATKKKRLILTLSPKLEHAINRLAAAQERPKAPVVVEILEQMAPQIEELASVVEQAKVAPELALQRLLGTFCDVMVKGGQLGQSMLSGVGEQSKSGDHD